MQELKTEIKQKRKVAQEAHLTAEADPNKKPNSGEANLKTSSVEETARAILRPDGFYEIKVDYAHCLKLAKITRVKQNDVLATTDEDNRARGG